MALPVARDRAALVARLAMPVVLLGFIACSPDDAGGPAAPDLARASSSLAAEVRQLAAGRGIVPLRRPAPVRQALVDLGRALAFDKELSGNRDIACMSCHLPGFGTGDDRSLSIGQGATGLGPDRVHPAAAFIPRNAPPTFNLFALESMFWDGRVSRDAAGTFHTPAGAKLTPAMTQVFEFGALSAQPLFPVVSRAEMRGDGGNELAAIADDQEPAIWAAIMTRLGRIKQYRRMFEAAYPGRSFDQMNFGYASNAIAGFLTSEFVSNDTPWDRFLAGNDKALSTQQLAGAKDFMVARCSICHNGPAFTDNQFHNVAVAQLGPGAGDGPSLRDDFGRMRVTGLATDKYAFRTPPAAQRGAHRAVGARRRVHRSPRVHRSLQRVGRQAARLRREPARVAPAGHAAEQPGRHPRYARPAAGGRGVHPAAGGRRDGVHAGADRPGRHTGAADHAPTRAQRSAGRRALTRTAAVVRVGNGVSKPQMNAENAEDLAEHHLIHL
jgi:cytochrome c peroxidase